MTQDDLIKSLVNRIGTVKFPPMAQQAREDVGKNLGFPLPWFLREF